MSNNKPPVFDPGLCRCCGNMKKCRLLNVEYEFSGQKEVYSDMMMDCFGILLSHLDGRATERLVCATCVVRLREATCFRQQVLRCEEAFLQMKIYDADGRRIHKHDDESSLTEQLEVESVKMEPEDGYSPALHAGATRDVADEQPDVSAPPSSDDDVPILQRLATRRTTAFPINIQRKRPTKRASRVNKTKSSDNIPPSVAHSALEKTKHFVGTELQNTERSMSTLQQQSRERDVTYKTETNILNIVEYSYVCPFKCRHNNLMCYYCAQPCRDPDTLRTHTLSRHAPDKFKVVEHKKMIKVDVTRIDCRLCAEKIDDLDTFKRHISRAHGKKYYWECSDSILPFRLTRGELECALCGMKHPYFHALNKHMNVHFSNFVCETCGLGFVDKCRFMMHRARHAAGSHECGECGKVFRAAYNRDLHVDRVHYKRARVYCPRCDLKLMSYPHKLKHLVEVHGEEPLRFPCGACERVYLTRRMLTIHQRKDHLKDYRYECQYCGQKFFTRFALDNHTPAHTGERNFKCKVCEKSYPRLKTLKDHMRIHSNDRRYRCHVCAQAFIQNCSLKGHMKSQHPEYG